MDDNIFSGKQYGRGILSSSKPSEKGRVTKKKRKTKARKRPAIDGGPMLYSSSDKKEKPPKKAVFKQCDKCGSIFRTDKCIICTWK
ncbi:hypothetical protein D3C78_18180 [compost metagenome]